MKNLTLRLSLIAAWLACATMSRAQSYEVLHSFANLTGYGLTTPLAQGPDATLYGTTSTGGSGNSGVVFRVQPNGMGYTVLKTFSFADPVTFTNADGAYPAGGLVLSGTNLYGTTYQGGPSGSGTVFSLGTNGSGYYNISCDCDALSPGSCPSCVNGSDPTAICVDIPTSVPAGFSAQADASLPAYARYFVPGFNCADLT